MGRRAGRSIALGAVIGALALAACTPTPPPPPNPTAAPAPNPCASADEVPGPTEQVAVVDQGGTSPEVVTFDASTFAEVLQEVAALETTGNVLSVDKNEPVSALSVAPADDPHYPSQWGFGPAMLDFDTAWNANGRDGTGIRVAVIDTGVQASHPDLNANVAQGQDFVFTDQTKSNYARIDGNGHGTHVAGTISAEDNAEGVVGGAPHTTIVPVRVLNCTGAGSTAGVAAGIYWAVDVGEADVINMSLGGSGNSQSLEDAVQHALEHGVVVVAAAGNCGSGSAPCSSVNTTTYPGAYPGVIGVGSITSTKERSSFSNFGTAANGFYVDVAAPGTGVVSTYSTDAIPDTQCADPAVGYCALSGTSMATPHVAAIVALIKQACPASTPAQILAHLQATGETLATDQPIGPLVRAGAATATCPT